MKKKKIPYRWVIQITIVSFVLSLIMSFLTSEIAVHVNIWGSVIVLTLVILTGVLFDILGVSITIAKPAMFHSLASRKDQASKLALHFIKNQEKVANFSNDVVGDICGILSGSISATIALAISANINVSVVVSSFIVTALVSAITIGLKAIGKTIAINHSETIVLNIAQLLNKFK